MVAYAYYEYNGRIEQYTKALIERGDTVDVIALNRGGLPAFETIRGVNVYRVQDRRVRRETFLAYVLQVAMFMFRAFALLAKKHFKNPYSLIHVHSVPDFLVFSALVPKLGGVPVILDIHDILPEFFLAKFRTSEDSLIFKLLVFIEKVSIAFSDHVIVANPIWRDRLLCRSARPDKVITLWNYPDPTIFFPRQKERSDGKFVLLYPGSLNWHQGLDIAIEAFAKVVQEIPEAEFRIYGEGPERDNLVRLARELGVEQQTHFEDVLSLTGVAESIADADLAVVPKRAKSVFGNEAASTKIMEFMAVGLPVIVSRTKIDTLYHSDATVRFFDADDPDNLAKEILCLHARPELRRELVANALRYVADNNWDAKKKEYLAVVDRLAERKLSKLPAESKGIDRLLQPQRSAQTGLATTAVSRSARN